MGRGVLFPSAGAPVGVPAPWEISGGRGKGDPDHLLITVLAVHKGQARHGAAAAIVQFQHNAMHHERRARLF